MDADLAKLEQHFKPAESIETYYAGAQTSTDRNRFIAGRLVLTNIRYIQFVRTLSSEKQALNAAPDILLLSLSIAGTAVGGESAKTVLAAISSGLAGAKAVVDKEYYYEKSIPALIAAMNAERTKVLLGIVEGMRSGIDVYTSEQALSDLHTFYMAGTLVGALQAIQADSGEKQKAAEEEIEKLRELPMEVIVTKRSLTLAIGKITTANLPAAQQLLTTVSGRTAPSRVQEVRDALQVEVRAAGTDERIAECRGGRDVATGENEKGGSVATASLQAGHPHPWGSDAPLSERA